VRVHVRARAAEFSNVRTRMNYRAAKSERALPKERRAIYFYTIRHLHFKRAHIYEISGNLSAARARAHISEKETRKREREREDGEDGNERAGW